MYVFKGEAWKTWERMKVVSLNAPVGSCTFGEVAHHCMMVSHVSAQDCGDDELPDFFALLQHKSLPAHSEESINP